MNCTLWCCAYILGVSSDILIAELGHDGKAVCWPEFADSRRYRGFALSEVQDLLFKRGKLLAPIFVDPVVIPALGCSPVPVYKHPELRYETMTSRGQSLLIGQVDRGVYHAIIRDGYSYIDPRGGAASPYMPADYTLQEAYKVCRTI